MTKDSSPFVGMKEAVRRTGLSAATLRKYAKAGRIEHMVMGTEKLKIYRFNVDAFMQANVKKAGGPPEMSKAS